MVPAAALAATSAADAVFAGGVAAAPSRQWGGGALPPVQEVQEEKVFLCWVGIPGGGGFCVFNHFGNYGNQSLWWGGWMNIVLYE